MTIKDICHHLNADLITGSQFIDREIKCGFASDLMSDVLTLDTDGMLLITGLANVQTIRTSEMADISCILFVRGKSADSQMIELANENDIVMMRCPFSMYRTVGILVSLGLPPVY